MKKLKKTTIISLIAYKKARDARRLIRFKKQKGFKKFITSINKNTGMKYVWNKIRVLRKPQQVVDWNKWQNKDRDKKILENIDKLAPCWTEKHEENTNKEKKKKSRTGLEGQFTQIQLERTLRKTKGRSARVEMG